MALTSGMKLAFYEINGAISAGGLKTRLEEPK
jgi:hypothetical protein